MYAAVQSSPTPQHAQRTVSTCWSEPAATALAVAVAALEATTSGRGLLLPPPPMMTSFSSLLAISEQARRRSWLSI
jgi:hypothetical protein